MRRFRQCLILLLALLLVCAPLGASASAMAPLQREKSALILFTHDTHSRFLPIPAEGGGESGGYVRLATLIRRERAEFDGAVVTLDGGDFSMGTLFQVVYETEAAELRALAAMEYDAVTLGNHEFDYRAGGFASMLNAAVAKSEFPLPVIVQANYRPLEQGDEGYDNGDAARAAMENYGIKEYTMLEREGVRFAIFGINGKESHEFAPMSGMALEDPIAAAKRVVAEIQANETYDYLICLSHSGTSENRKESEDDLLAKAVPEIDVIVSGHSHTVLSEPRAVGDTLIVSAGAYTKNLGVLELSKRDGKVVLEHYELIPVDETVEYDPLLVRMTDEFQQTVEEGYLADYHLGFDEVVAVSPFDFNPGPSFGSGQVDDPLGSLIADSYIYAVAQAEGERYVPIDLAVVPDGVIRASFTAGEITVADAFNVSSLGVGADGTPGYPLISVYLTGRELMDVFEVDASVTPLMDTAQLYTSGMRYTFNPYRMIFNKVTSAFRELPGGGTAVIEPDRLYRVVTGLYSGQMLGAVRGKSFGILSITAKDAQGNPVTNWEAQIIHTANGAEVKEWYALTSYLQALETVPEEYAAPLGRKIIAPSLSPVALLANPNWITLTVLAVLVFLILLVVVVIWLMRKRSRKKRGYSR